MKPVSTTAFFDGFFRGLEDRAWPAIILHSWENLPERIDSDVDYLVSGVSPSSLLEFLDDYCCRHGWILAQVLEHESNALYCVCFMSQSPWSTIKLDVAWDYSRKGTRLLSGEFLLAKRRKPQSKAFFAPSSQAEFAYVLAKGLAKAKGEAPVIGRLKVLWQEDPNGCGKVLAEHFGISSPDPTKDFPTEMISEVLAPTNAAFNRWRSRRWGASQIGWLYRRLRKPNGLTISVGKTIDKALLGETLLPAFRRFQILDSSGGLSVLRRREREYRSSLLIGTSENLSPAQSSVLDLRHEDSPDACVLAVLKYLQKRGAWAINH
jgi:hypothetical protein